MESIKLQHTEFLPDWEKLMGFSIFLNNMSEHCQSTYSDLKVQLIVKSYRWYSFEECTL